MSRFWTLAYRRWARARWLVAVAAVGLVAAGCIPTGNHTVSSFGAGGVSPGLYRTLGSTDSSCVWQRWGADGLPIAGGGPRFNPNPDVGPFNNSAGPMYARSCRRTHNFTALVA